MFLDYQQHYVNYIRKSLDIAVAPLQYFVNYPVQMIDWFIGNFTSRQLLLEQNADYQAQILLLNARLQKVMLLEKENTQLRALLQTQPRHNEKVLVSQLLAVDPDPFIQQVILNKGSKQGVYVGQPVLDGNGVFGQIIHAGFYTSRVMLITDAQSAVPVEDSRSGVRGIIVGNGDANTLSLIDMPVTEDIKVGDQLVTSGLGERYPMGYPVGIVRAITKSFDYQFAKIDIEPSAHLFRSHLVLLIWPANDHVAVVQGTNTTKIVQRGIHDH